MKYLESFKTSQEDPARLEAIFQDAVSQNDTAAFKADLLTCYEEYPSNLLFAAWYYRLESSQTADTSTRRSINWKLAIPLAFINALIFCLLVSDLLSFEMSNQLFPYQVLWWAPVISLVVIAFLSFTSKKGYRLAGIVSVALVLAVVFATLLSLHNEQYLILMALHIPLLSWAAVAITLMGVRTASHQRFSFLIKSIEVFVTAGLFLIAGMIFGGITLGLFAALSITPPDMIIKYLAAGGVGLIPVLAVAVSYDPMSSPADQDFSQGLGKLISTLPRLLIPLTLAVLVVYLFVIPFFFVKPFTDRDVLIVYNLMLFAIMGLLVGATPLKEEELAPKMKSFLRIGILALVILVVIVSLYALSATVYRTLTMGGLTINRMTILGWNVLNISLLVMMVVKILKAGKDCWVNAVQSVFSLGCVLYVLWSLLLLVTMGWLFPA